MNPTFIEQWNKRQKEKFEEKFLCSKEPYIWMPTLSETQNPLEESEAPNPKEIWNWIEANNEALLKAERERMTRILKESEKELKKDLKETLTEDL